MIWTEIQEEIDRCRICENREIPHLIVPIGVKRHPILDPPRPTRLLFVSVAPPQGGAYFWDETQDDRLRTGLFKSLNYSGSVHQFCKEGFYLVPAVKCPSESEGRDINPSPAAIASCARHLKDEIATCKPERILALGRCALAALAKVFGLRKSGKINKDRHVYFWVVVDDQVVPIGVTYFPGNRRHGHFDLIAKDITRILNLEPRRTTIVV